MHATMYAKVGWHDAADERHERPDDERPNERHDGQHERPDDERCAPQPSDRGVQMPSSTVVPLGTELRYIYGVTKLVLSVGTACNA